MLYQLSYTPAAEAPSKRKLRGTQGTLAMFREVAASCAIL